MVVELLSVYIGPFHVNMALLSAYRALLIVYRALVSVYKVLVSVYSSF